MNALPIRVRLTAAFAVAMAFVIGAMAVLVYVRVEGALLTSVDQTLRAQGREAMARINDEHGLVDPDAGGGSVFAQLLGPDGKPVRSTPAGLPPLLDAADAMRSVHGTLVLRTMELKRPQGEWRVLAIPAAGGRAVVVAQSLTAREEALHRIYRELFIAGPLAVLLASLAGYALAAAALRPVETMRRRAAGVTAASPGTLPVPRARDEISRLAVTLNDMLSRLQAALDHERRFVADASHELRTPVALLRTELELALRRPRSAEELKLALVSALDETVRLSRLADDLLLLARAEERSLPIRAEDTQLAELFDTVARRFAARAAGVGRTVRAAPTTAILEADPARLEQALDNLVDNALSYGAGEVVLFAQATDDAVELHVTDSGRGFDDAFLERAFDRFSRSDEAREQGGAGLGLSIVQLIAHVHGGTVGAGNRPGGGADVWLSLPRRAS
ncbi:MAG TPA: HAMP domain-containing sensor histidine kinase [Gaiellaceae bacterium]|nr:HAMP domain-containing sensor histidine kinase [Gaiellaceae bacterium]